MRIWDIHPGYLSRQSLLGEHRELHGIVSVIVNEKKGYSNHPETKRWVGYGWAIGQRHLELVCEMKLRGYEDKSPVTTESNKGCWPPVYIDQPCVQFDLLREKYKEKKAGRIPLPNNAQALWRHHKYSVLARDPGVYKEIGRCLSKQGLEFDVLALEMVKILRTPPSEGGIRNAVQHMWGYVAEMHKGTAEDIESWSLKKLLTITQKSALNLNEPYLMHSTALSELMRWL